MTRSILFLQNLTTFQQNQRLLYSRSYHQQDSCSRKRTARRPSSSPLSLRPFKSRHAWCSSLPSPSPSPSSITPYPSSLSLSTLVTSKDPSSPTRPRSETRCRQTAKRKVALIVAYEGSTYHGFQRNAGVQTVSDALEHALHSAATISDENVGHLEKIKWQVAARTDRGVSAAGNLVSAKLLFDKSELEIGQAFVMAKARINRFLPSYVRVLSISQITGSFNARSCCESRWYEYLIPLSVFQHGTFNQGTLNTNAYVPNDISNNKSSSDVSSNSSSIKNTNNGVNGDRINTSEQDSIILKKLDDILRQYEGSHLFHNFTVGIDHTLPPRVQARRFITECRCDTVPVTVNSYKNINGESTEISDVSLNGHGLNGIPMARIRIKGQSFMLHQIRKMVSLAIMVMQGRVLVDAIERSLSPRTLINIAPVPAVGLFLDCCLFGWYNEKQKSFLPQPIDMSDIDPLREDFKQSHVIPSIAKRFQEENVLQDYFNTIEAHPVQFE